MKRCWIFFICLILLASMAGAETGPTLSVDSGTAGMGEIVEIPVRLEGNPGFAGYQMDIVYDPALLLPLELEEGLGGAPVYNLQGVNGAQSCVKTAYAGMVDVQGDGVLFTLRFQVKEALQPGQSAALGLQNVLFFSAGGQNITPALRDGAVSAVSAGEAPVSAGQTVSDGGSASGQGTPAPSGASPSSDPAGGQASAPAGSPGGASASSLPAASGTASSAGGGASSGQSSAEQDGQAASPAPSSSADAPAETSSFLSVVFVGLGALLLAAAVCALAYFLKRHGKF